MPEKDTLLARYRHLFDITVEHRYFADSYCRSLHWQPAASLAGVLKNALCTWRTTTNGVSVYADVARTKLLKDMLAATVPPYSFGLSARTEDPLFRHYTDGIGSDPSAQFTLDSAKGVREGDGLIRLHAQECLSQDDRALQAAEDVLVYSQPRDPGMPREHRVPRPRATAPQFDIRIGIDIDSLEGNANSSSAEGSHYCLRFAARQTFWQYNVLGELAPNELGVVDAADQIVFAAHGSRRLANGHIAHAFRSKTAIPLQERASQRFQLRALEPGAERVLIKRLPVASAGQFSIEEHAGAPRWVSEIYVHC
ncbi:MAG: hypothetical protein ACK5UX_08390 [Burkholderiales bacterium]